MKKIIHYIFIQIHLFILSFHLIYLFFSPSEDVLADEKGECVICLEELEPGDVIARLPCLCIYHKKYVGIQFTINCDKYLKKKIT